jgi:hypothetical protein
LKPGHIKMDFRHSLRHDARRIRLQAGFAQPGIRPSSLSKSPYM